jgi:hypothetical protein
MMRRLIWMFVCAGYWGTALSTAWAAPESKPDAGPVCLYESKAYSEGAFVCVQKSLILTCTADGAHVSWKPVTEKDINDRCTAPTVQHYPPERHHHSHRPHSVARHVYPPANNQAKCFFVNRMQHCE